MNKLSLALLALLAVCAIFRDANAAEPLLVIHGGAGVIKSEISPEREKAFSKRSRCCW